MSWLVIYVAAGWMIRAAMIPVILRRQFAPGAAMAWLGIIFLHPYIGWTLYMTVGETRLGPHRVERHRELVAHYRSLSRADAGTQARVETFAPEYEPMIRQAERISSLAVLPGNSVELLGDAATIDRLVADIDAAATSVHLLYYIFSNDATGTRVADAVLRAAGRGVNCRVLADAVGSRAFFHRTGLGARLAAAGIETVASLPVAPIQRRLPRMDLRNHRKLAVIDYRIGYVGSQNVVDSDYGGRRGAPWVDLTGRFTGPIVRELGIVFAEDWAFETGRVLEIPPASALSPSTPGALMQLVPTGPTSPGENYRRLLLAALQSARRRIVLTTPYFVPDEPTLVALMMAADRGIEVNLMVPLLADHIFTAAAGRAHYLRLLRAGVRIFQFSPGLLHAKTVAVDDSLAMIGSANLDVRSFNLNFELTVLMYGREAVAGLSHIHDGWLAHSTGLQESEWAARHAPARYADSAISLLSPLL